MRTQIENGPASVHFITVPNRGPFRRAGTTYLCARKHEQKTLRVYRISVAAEEATPNSKTNTAPVSAIRNLIALFYAGFQPLILFCVCCARAIARNISHALGCECRRKTVPGMCTENHPPRAQYHSRGGGARNCDGDGGCRRLRHVVAGCW